ncbi:hypothetical protein TFUB4_02087 [Tannerella forsythia]|uniref:Uncharacterized protein n=1 Tax=Tannerella forsythia TaxID=28112 RepID=A0A1D3UUC1_TANFO|nr:hypothetical protein TFUB4_02087 [Tannerella forsythia]SCQ23598.1 hypothetical protein TFUB20_02119 [Tannerella forsythia]SCQ24759.1 hypothetical protein TFUB22_02139 [Tannerella forsythia]
MLIFANINKNIFAILSYRVQKPRKVFLFLLIDILLSDFVWLTFLSSSCFF